MYGNVKNMANYLAKSETLLTFVLPNKRVNAYTKYIAYTFRAYPCSASTLRRCACLATKGGTPSFYILTKLLTNKCQTRSKASIQGIIVPVPHLLRLHAKVQHLSTALQRLNLSKKLANLFAELKTLCTFVLGESTQLCHNVHTHYAYIKRCLLSTSACAVVSVLQNLTRQRLFCCPYITITFNDEWRTELKALWPRTIVTAVHSLHLLISYQSHSLSNSSKVILPNLSRRKDYTVAPYPCSVSGAMMSLKATTHRCTNSLQSSML